MSKTLGQAVDAIDGPLDPILDLWGELRRISGEAMPALQAEHVEVIAKALKKARDDERASII